MGYYIIKRILLFIPTLFIIAVLAFLLSRMAPGDPILMLNKESLLERSQINDVAAEDRIYKATAARIGLDKPLFYFQITNLAFPDTLYRVLIRSHRESLGNLIAQYGHWGNIQRYYRRVRALNVGLNKIPDGHRSEAGAIVGRVRELYYWKNETITLNQLEQINLLIEQDTIYNAALAQSFSELNQSWQILKSNPTRWKLWVPQFYWFGFDNQFHDWASKLVRGDFGISYKDGNRVSSIIGPAIRRTILLNGLAVLLAFGLAIPIGVFTAVHEGKKRDRWTMTFLFGLYSLPVFWIGTLMIIFLTTQEYGMDWFPTMGLEGDQVNESSPIGERLLDLLHHLALPLICLTYPSLAFIARQMRNSMVRTLKAPYIQTSRAKGLPERTIIWKHAFRNALFPIITLIASVFPFLLAGSFIVEYIFNINGMGLVTVKAIGSQDWPTVFGVMMISAFFTVIGIFISDMLYQMVDPRVSFRNKR